MALTPKQEHFCRCVASGMDYKNAYLTAYDWTGGDNGAAIEGLKIANKPDVQEKIKTLMKPLEISNQAKSVNARQQQIDFIKDRIIICKEKGDEQSIIRYTDMLNKIHGIYKEETDTNTQKPALSNVDTETLAKLVNVV